MPRLNRIPDHPRRIGAIERVDRHNPRRRSHVDLCQPFAADHVDTDKGQAKTFQFRPHRLANLALAFGQAGCLCAAAHRQV